MTQTIATLARSLAAGLALAAAGTTAALAAPVDTATAQGVLYEGDGMSVQALDMSALAPEARETAAALIESLNQRRQLRAMIAGGYAYYGAIAVPLEGSITPTSMTMSANLHDPQAAANAAFADCNAKIEAGCAVIGVILPEGYSQRDFTLSHEATTRFGETWDGQGPKYLAYSPGTNAWVIAKGTGADAVAVERCNEKAAASGGAEDCVIGISEE